MSHGGACGSKNVGTSNHKKCENHFRRKIKVSNVIIISVGLVGPKGMVKTELDGQQVNIPALYIYAMEGRRIVLYAD